MFGRDKENRVIHWAVDKNLVKIQDFWTLEMQFIAHRTEKLDSEASRDGWTMVEDTLGSGLRNFDLETVKFKIEPLEYYPQGLKLSLIVDMPWIINSVFKLILSLVSPKLRECVVLLEEINCLTMWTLI
jgi:hypothetical protein